MRTDKVLKNGAYAIFAYFLTAIMAILVRKLFVLCLPVEFLGYEGLFGNIFSLLALADFGVESLIKYRMYSAFAANDKDEICKLMAIYKMIYRFVGIFILIVGLVLVPFLRWIVGDPSLRWEYIYIVYGIQLISTLCTYFLAYKRILFVVDQCEYRCTRVDAGCSLLSYLMQIMTLLFLRSYIVYLLVKVFTNIMANWILAKQTEKEYSYANREVRITKKDIEQSGLWHDIKNNMVQKVASAVWSSTDNILISILLGITNVGLISNYTLVSGYVTSILDKILNAFQSSIGNMIYTNDKKMGNDMFHMFNMVEFLMSSFVACSFFVLINPLITLWLGDGYTVGVGYVLFFSLNQYVMWNHRFITYYRTAFGKYEEDRNYILAGAILNIVCSIALAKPMGIAGIMLGTVIGHVGFWVGRVKVVYREYVDEPIRKYILRQIRNLLILTVELLLLFFLCNRISDNIIGFAGKMLLCIIIPNGINFLLFYRTKEMKLAMRYAGHVKELIKGKIPGRIKGKS